MENPQTTEPTGTTITTVDAVNLLYYASIGLIPQQQGNNAELKNAIIAELTRLLQENDLLRKYAIELERDLKQHTQIEGPVALDIIEEAP